MHLTAEDVQQTIDALGWTQQRLADDLGVARSGLNRYLKNGLPLRMNSTVRSRLVKHASEQGVIETADHEAGVFL